MERADCEAAESDAGMGEVADIDTDSEWPRRLIATEPAPVVVDSASVDELLTVAVEVAVVER